MAEGDLDSYNFYTAMNLDMTGDKSDLFYIHPRHSTSTGEGKKNPWKLGSLVSLKSSFAGRYFHWGESPILKREEIKSPYVEDLVANSFESSALAATPAADAAAKAKTARKSLIMQLLRRKPPGSANAAPAARRTPKPDYRCGMLKFSSEETCTVTEQNKVSVGTTGGIVDLDLTFTYSESHNKWFVWLVDKIEVIELDVAARRIVAQALTDMKPSKHHRYHAVTQICKCRAMQFHYGTIRASGKDLSLKGTLDISASSVGGKGAISFSDSKASSAVSLVGSDYSTCAEEEEPYIFAIRLAHIPKHPPEILPDVALSKPEPAELKDTRKGELDPWFGLGYPGGPKGYIFCNEDSSDDDTDSELVKPQMNAVLAQLLNEE